MQASTAAFHAHLQIAALQLWPVIVTRAIAVRRVNRLRQEAARRHPTTLRWMRKRSLMGTKVRLRLPWLRERRHLTNGTSRSPIPQQATIRASLFPIHPRPRLKPMGIGMPFLTIIALKPINRVPLKEILSIKSMPQLDFRPATRPSPTRQLCP